MKVTMGTVLQKVKEGLLEQIYSEINKQRLGKGLPLLSDDERKAINNEVSTIRAEKYFAETYVYDEEYIESTVKLNLQEDKNQGIIKRFSQWFFGKEG